MGKRLVVLLLLIIGLLVITACSKEDNENSEVEQFDINASLSLDNLSGMFYGFRSDFGGNECGGICWDIYTFLQEDKILVGVPVKGGPEKIDCTIDSCQDYTIENGQIIIGSDSFPIEITGDTLRINDVQLTRVLPVPNGTVFNNQYKYISYSGLIGITGGASSKTLFLTLKSDGTFELEGVSIGSVGGLSGTDTTGSFTDDTQIGTYKIENNTIELTSSDGTVENVLFFIHDGNVNDIQLGERNYYVDKD